MYIYIYVCMYVCIYMYMYIHTYLYTYIHTCICIGGTEITAMAHNSRTHEKKQAKFTYNFETKFDLADLQGSPEL